MTLDGKLLIDFVEEHASTFMASLLVVEMYKVYLEYEPLYSDRLAEKESAENVDTVKGKDITTQIPWDDKV
jgi:hypothetical protein